MSLLTTSLSLMNLDMRGSAGLCGAREASAHLCAQTGPLNTGFLHLTNRGESQVRDHHASNISFLKQPHQLES